PIGIVLQPRIHRRMADAHERSECEQYLARAAREPAAHGLTRRHTAADLERISHRITGGREPRAQFEAITGSLDLRPELAEQPADRGPYGLAETERIGRLEGAYQVGLLERPGQRCRIRDDAARNQVFDVRHRPVA